MINIIYSNIFYFVHYVLKINVIRLKHYAHFSRDIKNAYILHHEKSCILLVGKFIH